MAELRPIHELAPFGNPDGSRATLEDITRDFVNFGSAATWGGLSTREDDRTARVLVGRKGSGKTIYLRRLRAHAALDGSLYADHIQQDLPQTQQIIKFCQWFPEALLTEQWMSLWHKAILRSVLSHILNDKHLSSRVDSTARKNLLSNFREIIRPFKAKVSAYSQISEIINSCHTRPAVERFLSKPQWSKFESMLTGVVATCPPLCLYLVIHFTLVMNQAILGLALLAAKTESVERRFSKTSGGVH